jgi:hypothetical protein
MPPRPGRSCCRALRATATATRAPPSAAARRATPRARCPSRARSTRWGAPAPGPARSSRRGGTVGAALSSLCARVQQLGRPRPVWQRQAHLPPQTPNPAPQTGLQAQGAVRPHAGVRGPPPCLSGALLFGQPAHPRCAGVAGQGHSLGARACVPAGHIIGPTLEPPCAPPHGPRAHSAPPCAGWVKHARTEVSAGQPRCGVPGAEPALCVEVNNTRPPRMVNQQVRSNTVKHGQALHPVNGGSIGASRAAGAAPAAAPDARRPPSMHSHWPCSKPRVPAPSRPPDHAAQGPR